MTPGWSARLRFGIVLSGIKTRSPWSGKHGRRDTPRRPSFLACRLADLVLADAPEGAPAAPHVARVGQRPHADDRRAALRGHHPSLGERRRALDQRRGQHEEPVAQGTVVGVPFAEARQELACDSRTETDPGQALQQIVAVAPRRRGEIGPFTASLGTRDADEAQPRREIDLGADAELQLAREALDRPGKRRGGSEVKIGELEGEDDRSRPRLLSVDDHVALEDPLARWPCGAATVRRLLALERPRGGRAE